MSADVLLYNHSGCENRGCEAIVRGTAALLAARGGLRLTLASAQPEVDRTIALPGIGRVIPSVISPWSVQRMVNSVGFRLGMPRENEVARRFSPVIAKGKRSALCLSVGGDTYCYGPQEHMRVINGRLKRAGVPLVLWGCSVDPELLRGERLEDLGAYDLIVARESMTAEAMRDAGLPVRLWRDPAFWMQPQASPLPEAWQPGATVGLNISPLVLDRMGDRAAGITLFAALIRHILATTPYAVALFSHVTWTHDDDSSVVRALQEAFPGERRVFALPDTLRAPELKAAIARMELLVTARTHASIAGYSQGIPTLVIGYSVKARGIARDLFGNEAGHVLPGQQLREASTLTDAFDALCGRAAAERMQLTERLPRYLREGEDALDEVLALCRRGGKA